MMEVLVAGDLCLDNRFSGRAKDNRCDVATSLLPDVIRHVLESVYAIMNLECSVSGNISSTIAKIGPNLQSNSEVLTGLAAAGFKCVALANNHFADYGEKALSDSLNLIDEAGLDRCGAGEDIQEAKSIFYKEIDGRCLQLSIVVRMSLQWHWRSVAVVRH